MKYYGITDRGTRRTNQDSYVIATNTVGDVFALICDGIGGSRGGDVASQMAVSSFSRSFADTDGFENDAQVKEWLRIKVQEINKEIFHMGNTKQSLKGMGTTLCGVLLTSCGRYVINIGDSRAYSYRYDGKMRQLTVDHTLINDMLLHGELTREEAENYPQKNVLTNALGVWESVRCDIDTHPEKVDGFLLCTDGLHGYVPEEEILQIVLDRKYDPARRARKLVKAALKTGGYDNITAILIDLEGEDA